jgi:hypothetical protein
MIGTDRADSRLKGITPAGRATGGSPTVGDAEIIATGYVRGQHAAMNCNWANVLRERGMRRLLARARI